MIIFPIIVVLISTHEMVPIVAVLLGTSRGGSNADRGTATVMVLVQVRVLVVFQLVLLKLMMLKLMLMLELELMLVLVLVLVLQAAVLRDLGGLHDWQAGRVLASPHTARLDAITLLRYHVITRECVGIAVQCYQAKDSATWRASKLKSRANVKWKGKIDNNAANPDLVVPK